MSLYINNMTTGVLLELDFKNVFNSVRRDRMLMVVKESTPERLEFVYSAYAQPSYLFCKDHIIHLYEGVQQGPPGPPTVMLDNSSNAAKDVLFG